MGMENENGAAGMSRADSEAELDALKQQVEADTNSIAQIEASLADKKDQWKVRSTLRSNELAAISKAIEILSNDDAKDLFKKSLASQGAFFLQESVERSSMRDKAAQQLSVASV